MRRVLLAFLLIVGLAPGLWFYETRLPWNRAIAIRFTEVPLPSPAELARHLGAFELEGAWSLTSPYGGFGGYSALVALPGERLMALSDNGRRFTFSPPGSPARAPESGEVMPQRGRSKFDRDVEAAARDPDTGTIWLAREYLNAISRHRPGFPDDYASVRPPAMRDWGDNSGPEALVRLSDGRFIALEEAFAGRFASRRHRAVLFPRDPLLGGKPVPFTFAGDAAFSPTDMAQLPDGRVLILMRRLVWPFPLRFAGRILIADPGAIRAGKPWQGTKVAKLSSTLPVDNFEGMAIAPRADGRVTVWLISDANGASTQRTILWKLVVDPARLPARRENAREPAPRPS